MSFRKLPTELQALIWNFSLHERRIVDIFAFSINETLQERAPGAGCSGDALSASWVQTYIERVYAATQPLSPVFHVCRESRALVIQRYVQLNADTELLGERELENLPPRIQSDDLEIVHCRATVRGDKPFALLDPRKDILFLQDPHQMMNSLGGPLISSLAIMMRWMSKEIIEHLRSIAIPYFTWRKTRKVESLELLMGFKGLEELYVSFLGGQSIVQAHTWLDEVNGVDELGVHFKEVEMEVLADVENLARQFPNWRRPMVRVVKHRSVLARELES